MAACGSQAPAKPDIPESIAPGWKLSSLEKSTRPQGLDATGSPTCWKAVYGGAGSAETWLCWYKVSGNAFEAVQKARTEAQTVKFQEGQYFVTLRWNNVTRADITALVRALQRSLHSGT